MVYLLDGIRFSTSTFRAGATQYLAWIDPGFVDRVEVLRGPSSMQYGSDALGGSLNVLTRSPRLSPDAVRASGVVDLAVRGADRGSVAGAVIDVAGPHAALSAGATARGSREFRTGRGTDSRAAVTRFVGLPSTVLYTRLPRTDYGQTSGRLAGVVGVGDGEVTGSYLHTGQHGVNRFHRELGGDGLHRSEFEPQRLDVGNLRYRADRAGPLTSLIGAFSFNRQQDDRLEQARPSTRVEREARGGPHPSDRFSSQLRWNPGS